MARSEDEKDGKRGPSRPKAASASRKDTTARAGKGTSPPASSRKKTAAPSESKGGKPAASPRATPSVKRTKQAAPKPARPGAAKDAKDAKDTKPARSAKASAPAKAAPAKPGARAAKPAASGRPEGKPAAKKATARKATARAAKDDSRQPVGGGLDEEQRIEDAKYQPRDLTPRLFEEERFIFPESYGQSRIRLLVKDPEWLFAHWDVDPQSLADLRAELGERASALAKLTLRVADPQHGGESRVLLPEGARSWYVRADAIERSYRAQLGLTLPSGEFRSLAESNTVRTPRTGPAPGAAPRRARYDGVTPEPAAPVPLEPPHRSRAGQDPGPWKPDPRSTSYPGPGGASDRGPAGITGRREESQGGASDAYRR